MDLIEDADKSLLNTHFQDYEAAYAGNEGNSLLENIVVLNQLLHVHTI